MSSEVSTIALDAQKTSEYKRHQNDMKKIQQKNINEYRKSATTGTVQKDRLEKEYESQFAQEKVKLETKLNEIREKYSQRIREEKQKFEDELVELKKTQGGRLSEINETNQRQLETTVAQQKNFLDMAKLRFEEEKAKYKS